MSLPAHCPRCGGKTERLANSTGRCTSCGHDVYANSKPTAGVLLERAGKLLLVRRAEDPGKGKWDVPGGYLKEGEHPEDGARREIKEELGLDLEQMRLAFIEQNELDDFVALDILFEAVAPYEQEPVADSDAAELAWFALDDLPLGELAFATTRRIVDRYVTGRIPGELRLLGGDVIRLDERTRVGSGSGPWHELDDWRVECGEWSIHDDVLCGRVEGEHPAALWYDQPVEGDHAIEFRAWTVPPKGNDINCFWEGSGSILDEAGDVACTVAGFGGWWSGLSGIERYPEGGLATTARLAELAAGRAYRIVAGRRGQTDFLFVDGRLVMEIDDPSHPRRPRSYVALATWNSHIHVERVAVHQLR